VRRSSAAAAAAAGVLALGCAGCSALDTALDTALDDPGDADLVADASVRAQATAPERLDLDRRAVDVRLAFAGDSAPSVVLTAERGVCGWSGEGAWRVSLGDGVRTLSTDDEGRTWAGVLLTARAGTGDSVTVPDEPVVLDAVLEASYSSFEEGGSTVVSQEGRLEVDASGTRAVFTAPPPTGEPEGDEGPPLAGTEVVVVCGEAPADG
jgi:hypothetical protein